jgi:hypothetical protein
MVCAFQATAVADAVVTAPQHGERATPCGGALISWSNGHRSADGYMSAIALHRSGLSGDLQIDSIGVFHMQTGKIPLQGSRTMLCQITRDRFPAVTGYPNGEMIDSAGRASVVERDQGSGVAEPNNFYSSFFRLAHDGEPEHLPIEVGGALDVSDLNADMVDVRSFEIDVFLSGGSRAARRQHRETLNQFSTGE